MSIRSSLKRKSIIALAVYLALVITVIGTVSYMVVEPPIRDQLERNLDTRNQLLSEQISEPLNSSLGILQSVVSIGNTGESQAHQEHMLFSLFSVLDGITVSGGLWPIPYSIDKEVAYSSLFFNRASDGKIDKVTSWDNPESGGYDKEDWYTSVVNQPMGTVSWSQVYIDAFTHVQMITASSPYYINGEFAGVATVDLSLAELVDFVRRHAEQNELGVLLRDAHGDVITEHNFQLVKGIYISQNSFGDFNWNVEVVNSKRLVAEQVYDLVTKVETGIIPIMLICVMAGYVLINRSLIRPITVIAQKVDDSRRGGIIDMTYRSDDEIKHLIDTFNQKTVYLEAEKVKAQASTKAKSAFLATLSHEIRTPMNGVLGTAQILLKTQLSDEQRKHLKTLYDSGDHMMTLLNEILDFSKIEQGHLELEKNAFPFDSIVGSINSVYHTLCSEKGLQFKVYSEISNGRWYRSDKARLRQVLFNLLNNAVKFTSRGYVEVYFREVEKDGNNYLSIKVRDTGIGIAKSAHEKVFKPFEQAESSTTRRFGGTGLGLAIVKQITDLMNGSIELSSEPGIGTSFEVLLEMEISTAGSVEIKEHHKLDYSGLRALIVEDNRTNAIILTTFMSNKGFTCECVENGELAVYQVVNNEYDLILMDNHMPVMDGVEAISAIRALNNPQSKILIFGCTADVFKETRERMLGSGADYIVAKPIDEAELDDALYRYAKKLYQFKPQAKAVEQENNIEQTLLEMYLAVESQDIPRVTVCLTRLDNALPENIEASIQDTLTQLKQQLMDDVLPSQTELDVLTVLLKDYCS
ncbi:ATP-binding protein [Vibrio sp. NTOU-M3]|uniref:hybrid sensor histidine kinase/response regulator n=1 Tax=Vibrio sp. NTOU-M3 TaxID=3234954 RepID=UPI00349F489A